METTALTSLSGRIMGNVRWFTFFNNGGESNSKTSDFGSIGTTLELSRTVADGTHFGKGWLRRPENFVTGGCRIGRVKVMLISCECMGSSIRRSQKRPPRHFRRYEPAKKSIFDSVAKLRYLDTLSPDGSARGAQT